MAGGARTIRARADPRGEVVSRRTQAETPVTKRQREMVALIRAFMREHQTAPTVRELGDLAGISSPNAVVGNLRALRAKGLIQFGGGKTRNIRLVGETTCPYCGHEHKGTPSDGNNSSR